MFRGSVSDSYSNFLNLASWQRKGRREASGFLGLVNNTVALRSGLGVCQPVVLDLTKRKKGSIGVDEQLGSWASTPLWASHWGLLLHLPSVALSLLGQ